MSIVTLVSGGLDSSLIALLAKSEGIIQYPLFVNYGQLACRQEWAACQRVHAAHSLPQPVKIDVEGFGSLITSGLTAVTKDTFRDAFLPNRNLLFLLVGSAYAYQQHADAVTIGFLNEETRLFPDQSIEFLRLAEGMVRFSLGLPVRLIAPLSSLYKSDVLQLASRHGLQNTYSCHKGEEEPCGTCVSCKELLAAQVREG